MKKDLGIFVLLVVLCTLAWFQNPRFINSYNLQNLARTIGEYGIFGIGVGVVIITGGIDLSIGSVLALQGVLLAVMLTGGSLVLLPETTFFSIAPLKVAALPWPMAVLIVLAGVSLLGLIHAFLIVKAKLQPFIVTLCGYLIYRGVARFMAADETKGFGDSQFGILRKRTTGMLFDTVPMPFVILVVIAIIMWVVIHKSVYGRYLFAVGRNEEAARYSGIHSKLIIGSAYVLCMFLTGIAGILLSLDVNSISASDFGTSYELYGIAAAVLGGCSLRGGEGSIVGIVIGTALLQVLQNIVNLLGIPSSLNFAVMGAVILIGVLTDQMLAERKKRKIAKIPANAPAKGFEVTPPRSPA